MFPCLQAFLSPGTNTASTFDSASTLGRARKGEMQTLTLAVKDFALAEFATGMCRSEVKPVRALLDGLHEVQSSLMKCNQAC